MKKLYGHHDSGHAFKIKFFLEVAGIEHDYEWVDIWQEREQRPAGFQSIARYGEVPVLVDDGYAYVQSNAILLHLAIQSGKWGAESADTLATCREWLAWEANKIGLCMPQLRVHHKFGGDAELDQAMPWLMNRYDHDINWLEQAFSDGRDWVVGNEQPSVADFSLCGYLYFADEAKVAVPPKVAAWLQRLSKLPGWKHPYQLLENQTI